MAIQYANLTYSFVVDDYVDLPAGVPPGQLAYVVNTAKAYYSTNGTWKEVLLAGAGGFQPYTYSFDNPPASPSTYDDEFNSTSLNAKWTLTSVGTTNPTVAGTINPIGSLTTPIYDLQTWPSWFLFQSDNSTSGARAVITQSISISADATIIAKVSWANNNLSADPEGTISLSLLNSTDSNEELYVAAYNGGSGWYPRLVVVNNGTPTNSSGSAITEAALLGNSAIIAIFKNGNTYWMGRITGSDGTFSVLPTSVTKSGVTTFDQLSIKFHTSNETPSWIGGVDFVRYYPSLTYALMN